jgi:hypothetical protein
VARKPSVVVKQLTCTYVSYGITVSIFEKERYLWAIAPLILTSCFQRTYYYHMYIQQNSNSTSFLKWKDCVWKSYVEIELVNFFPEILKGVVAAKKKHSIEWTFMKVYSIIGVHSSLNVIRTTFNFKPRLCTTIMCLLPYCS